MKTYTNNLTNRTLRMREVGDGLSDYIIKNNKALCVDCGFNTDKPVYFFDINTELENRAKYIIDVYKIRDIFSEIKTIEYINAGQNTDKEWKCNKHTFIINGFVFEYKTGLGIACDNFSEILFDAVMCFISEANCLSYCPDIDDFLEEYGYTDSLESVRKGEKAYKDIIENKKKILKIWNSETIDNIYNYIEL